MTKTGDSIQEQITRYASVLQYAALSPEAVHAAKVRLIDTLGALIAGFFCEPGRIARNVAAQMPQSGGATVIGTRLKTTPDMAAFANATTARYVELTDTYHWPGTPGGHPSDVVMPVLAAAEYAQASGRDLITGIVLAYEVYLRSAHAVALEGFDYTNRVTLGTAVAAAKLFGLSSDQLAHAISMAVVPNNILQEVRRGHLSMLKAGAAGFAGRAGVFAALLARAGMEGPHLPFEGKAGWCEHITRKRFSLDTWGGDGTPFKIPDTQIKPRPSNGGSIPSILAAEKVAPLRDISSVKQIVVETYGDAKEAAGIGEQRWNPQSKESADHSIPYVTAVTLLDGTVTLRSYDDAHLRNPLLRALMQKIEVIENEAYTKAYNQHPIEHHTRVTVVMESGEALVGKTGGGDDDLAAPKSDAQIEQKFRGLTEDVLSAKQVDAIFGRLWHLEDIENAAEIPPAFVIV